MTTYNPNISHVISANNFDERRDIVRVNLRPYVNALNVDAPNEQNQDTSSTVCCGCINTRREFTLFICCCIALTVILLLAVISSVSITLLVVNSNENDNSTDSINNQSTGKSPSSEEDMPVNEENDISIHSPNIESTIAIEPEDVSPSSSPMELGYESVIEPEVEINIEDKSIQSISMVEESEIGTYYVNKGNIDEFQDDIEEYINDYNTIIFEEDLDILTIPYELTITKDIEMKSLSDSKLKLSCPDTGKRLFNIKNKANVKFTSFELSDCKNLVESLFSIEGNSALTLEKMEFYRLQSNSTILIESYESEIYMDEIYFKYNDISNYGFYFENTTSEIKNSQFSSNKIYGNASVVIKILEYSDIYFENTIFNDNDSDGYNTAMIYDDSSITMNYVEAKSNKMMYGGGGFASFDRCNLTVSNSICNQNEASSNNFGGGCFFIDEDTAATLNNVTMKENKTGAKGGAIYLMESSTLIIKDSEFYGNSAKDSGAVLYIKGSSCSVENSLFESNSATNGSCFTLDDQSSFYAEFTEFIDNSADFGSIGYLEGKSKQEITLKNCILENNIGKENEDKVYEEYKDNESKISINEK